MSTPAPATTEWVPLWDLNGGVNLDYKGAWAAGTYKDGEIVVHNGIAYLCVRQTTRTPTPWPAASSYGTSLPASPVDGQEAVLVDSVTAPNYQWRFRYNAQSSYAQKWEFIGGFPKLLTGGTTSWQTGSSEQMVPGWGTISVPRTGTYWVDWQCQASGAAFPAHITEVGVFTPGVGRQGILAMFASSASPNTTSYTPQQRDVLGLTAGQVIGIGGKSDQAPLWDMTAMRLEMIPVRVS